LGLDIEVGNTVAMQKCDAVHQLLAKILNLAARKLPEVESVI
jgi:hypothetical protein